MFESAFRRLPRRLISQSRDASWKIAEYDSLVRQKSTNNFQFQTDEMMTAEIKVPICG